MNFVVPKIWPRDVMGFLGLVSDVTDLKELFSWPWRPQARGVRTTSTGDFTGDFLWVSMVRTNRS